MYCGRLFSICEVMVKKALILSALLLSVQGSQASLYSIFGKLGTVADYFISKGDLSPENESVFNEVAETLGIADRQIKAQNSGLILRLLIGYNNALACAQLNRVYFNDSELNKMTLEQKRFLIAHELTHHAKHHVWKIMAFAVVLAIAQKKYIEKAAIHTSGHSAFIDSYFKEGIEIPMFMKFSIWGLIRAQYQQVCEKEADQGAILEAGVHPQDGEAMLNALYKPDTSDWPLYARVNQWIASFLIPIMALPVLKQHVPHLASHEERVADLYKFEDEWKEKFAGKVNVDKGTDMVAAAA